ncbi:MAG TPA: hypothetical protein VHK00_06930 [Miltoncostaeaceae bacterium]|nr:hypothetical protein [Miltoncostaeaceae bacterium]
MPGPADVVVECFRRMYGEGDLDAAEELVAEDYVNHEAAAGRWGAGRGCARRWRGCERRSPT